VLKVFDIANLKLAKFMYCANKNKVFNLLIKPFLRISTKFTSKILEAAHQNVIFSLLLTLQQAKVSYLFMEYNTKCNKTISLS